MMSRPDHDDGRRPLSRRRLLHGSVLAAAATGVLPTPRAWAASPSPTIAPPSGCCFTSATWHGDRLVAVGRLDDGDAACWVHDLRGWRRVEARGLDGASLRAVTGHGAVLVAVGTHSSGEASVWTSAGGEAWRRVAVGVGVLTGVAAAGSTLLAVGARADGETAEGAGALVLRSTDARTWVPLDSSGLPNGSETGLSAVARHAGRWVAAGYDVGGAVLWESADAVAWGATSAPVRAGAVVAALRPHGERLVAVTSAVTDAGPRVWSSGASRRWTESAVDAESAAGAVGHDVVPLDADDGRSLLLVGAVRGQALTVQTTHR